MGERRPPLGLRMSRERRKALIPKTDSNWVAITLKKEGLALSRYVRKMS
jgi:hypothetical protein